MKKASYILIVVIVLFALVTILFFKSNNKNAVKLRVDYPIIFGSFEAEENDVNVKVPGKVADIYVSEGDEVKAGDKIAVFEAENIKAKVEQARAVYSAAKDKNKQAKIAYEAQIKQSNATILQANSALEAANAQLSKVKAGARPQQLTQASLLVEQAKAAYELSKSNYERMEQLAKQNLIAQQKMDFAKTDMDVSKAKYDSAVEQFNLVKEGAQKEDIEAATAVTNQANGAVALANAAKMQIELRKQDIEASKAQMMQAEAAVKEAESYLNDSTIIAPISGIITSKNVDKGELVSTGMPVVTISDIKNMWLNLKISENDISKFQYGKEIIVMIPAMGNKEYKGKISYIASKPSFAVEKATPEKGERDVVYFLVKVKIDNSDEKLKPGMTGAVEKSGI